MTLDHEAIYKAYPNVVRIGSASRGPHDVMFPWDEDENKVTLVQSKVDEARATLNAEYAAVKYKDDRKAEYPDYGTQLDYIYHNGIDKWKTDIVDPVKNKYPKPS